MPSEVVGGEMRGSKVHADNVEPGQNHMAAAGAVDGESGSHMAHSSHQAPVGSANEELQRAQVHQEPASTSAGQHHSRHSPFAGVPLDVEAALPDTHCASHHAASPHQLDLVRETSIKQTERSVIQQRLTPFSVSAGASATQHQDCGQTLDACSLARTKLL